jgi:aubergine
VKRSLYD